MGEVTAAMAALDREAAAEAVSRELEAGRDPLELIEEARQGLEEVGRKFDAGEYFLIELIRAAQVFQACSDLITPVIRASTGDIQPLGTVVLGTVKGDIHDLGKNIVKVLLECKGIRVIDLGVDVTADRFIAAVRESGASVVGMSALLTASFPQFAATVEALREAGLQGKTKTIVGGGTVIDVPPSVLDADYIAHDANEGARVISEWMAGAPTNSPGGGQ